MASDALRDVRSAIAGGRYAVTDAMKDAILARLDEVIDQAGIAERALAKLPRPDIPECAARLARVRYLTGSGWRRYLRDSDAGAAAGAAIEVAMGTAFADAEAVVRRALSAPADDAIVVRSPDTFAVPCAICGADAITLARTRVSAAVQEQLVITSLSPVTVFRPVSGARMNDLIALLEAGSASAVVRHLRETHPGGCDAWCVDCDRVFCKDHYAIEAQWTGSWHEATYATCALGHVHTID
jgi:hypothetical protein